MLKLIRIFGEDDTGIGPAGPRCGAGLGPQMGRIWRASGLVIPVILLVSGNQTALESLADQETGKIQQVRIEPAICPVSQILVTAVLQRAVLYPRCSR